MWLYGAMHENESYLIYKIGGLWLCVLSLPCTATLGDLGEGRRPSSGHCCTIPSCVAS